MKYCISKNLSKRQEKAFEFFLGEIFSYQMQKNLKIRICFRKNTDVLGLTIVDDYNFSGAPRYFTIEVDRNQTEDEKIRTIAHELIHVKQYVKKELNEEMNRWKGQKVNPEKIPYLEQPWEIEANDSGDFLFNEFLKRETNE